MTEMEMVKELRRVVASAAGQAGGNREKVKAGIRAKLVSTAKERFGKHLHGHCKSGLFLWVDSSGWSR